MTIYFLIIIGTLHGQPTMASGGSFQTAAECQREWQLLAAAAALTTNHADNLAAACVAYKVVAGKDI